MTLWSRNLTRSHDKLKTTSASECQWTPKLDRMVNYLEGLPHIQLLDSFVTWSCEIPWQTKTILSPVLQCLWPPILAGCWRTFPGSYPESHMTFNQEFLQITWQAKAIISPLSHCPLPWNLAGWWLTLWGSYPWSYYLTFWSCGFKTTWQSKIIISPLSQCPRP